MLLANGIYFHSYCGSVQSDGIHRVMTMGSSSALKKLNKLRKKTLGKVLAKGQSKALAELRKLEVSSRSSDVRNTPPLSREVKSIAHEALFSAARELVLPCKPLMSWFQEGHDWRLAMDDVSMAHDSSSAKSALPEMSVLHLPLKSPACRKCPAKAGGMCRCAAKKLS